MAVELYNAITTTDNIAFSQSVADVLTTTGQLLIFLGPTFGGTVLGAVATIMAVGAFRAAEDLQRRIAEEINRRNQKDPEPEVTVVTLDPSKMFPCNYCWKSQYFCGSCFDSERQ